MSKHYPPVYKGQKFHCPFCNVYAAQVWFMPAYANGSRGMSCSYQGLTENFDLCYCTHCDRFSVWKLETQKGKTQVTMIYPDTAPVAMPHEDMPADVRKDFEEARGIVTKSPRGAAALLRLSIQKLMKDLGEPGKNINTDIGNLVKKGMPVEIQQAWDTVRVIGNESVHPGTIDLRDTPEIAHALFDIVNVIVQVMISQPKKIKAIYDSLPKSKLEEIERRDGK